MEDILASDGADIFLSIERFFFLSKERNRQSQFWRNSAQAARGVLSFERKKKMSAFGNYKRSCAPSSGSGGGGSASASSFSAFAAHKTAREDSTGGQHGLGARKKKKAAVVSDSDEDILESFFPKEDSDDDAALAPLLSAGMGMGKKKARACALDKDMQTEDHDYVRDRCVVPSEVGCWHPA